MLDAGEIQGNVLPGFNTRHQVLLGVRFGGDDPGAARQWLAALLPAISTLLEVDGFRDVRRSLFRLGAVPPMSPVWTNVAFSARGLGLLLGTDVGAVRDGRFRQGMGVDSRLGDPRDPAHEGHPYRWVVGGTPDWTPDALVTLGGDDLDRLRERTAGTAAAASAGGHTVMYGEEGHVLEGEIEHFGFRDGISSAGARGHLRDAGRTYLTRRYLDPADERAARFGRPGQPLVWPGQFVFGYPRQRDDDPVRPGPVCRGGYEWMDNGSFVVFRRLRQDVAAFRRFLDEQAAELGMAPGHLAALLVGRWPKGTALVRTPAGEDPDADPMADRLAVNHFGFAEDAPPVDVRDGEAVRRVEGAAGDRFGRICPAFAHIRKVNRGTYRPTRAAPIAR